MSTTNDLTPTPPITAAYVWTCASDFRASLAIADTASLYVHPSSISVACTEADLASLIAFADMLDEPGDIRSQSAGESGSSIVAVHGKYRGVYSHAQSTFPTAQVESILSALAADRVAVTA